MTEFGFMGVDWEERINFDRLRRQRLQKAKDALAASDADVLFVFRPEDVRYLTGHRMHLGPTVILTMCACVLPKGGEPLLFTHDMIFAKAKMPWLNPELIFDRPNCRSEKGVKQFVEQVRSILGSQLDGKVGVDIGTFPMWKALQEALPNSEFVDGYDILCKAKVIKTQDEIECLRAATMITEAGLDAALRVLRPGVRECEVLAEAWRAFTALGSEWTQCSNIVCSGPYTAPYRRFTSDRIIREGDPVVIDIGACFNGYWGDFTRTFICGDIDPTPEQIELHQESYDTLFAACEAAQPGDTNFGIHKALQNPHGDHLSGGHGAGVSPWEPPWVTAITDENLTTLLPGMVFSIEPYAGKPGIGGFRLENNVLVTENGPEIYSPYPFDERLLKRTHPMDKTTGRKRRGGFGR